MKLKSGGNQSLGSESQPVMADSFGDRGVPLRRGDFVWRYDISPMMTWISSILQVCARYKTDASTLASVTASGLIQCVGCILEHSSCGIDFRDCVVLSLRSVGPVTEHQYKGVGLALADNLMYLHVTLLLHFVKVIPKKELLRLCRLRSGFAHLVSVLIVVFVDRAVVQGLLQHAGGPARRRAGRHPARALMIVCVKRTRISLWKCTQEDIAGIDRGVREQSGEGVGVFDRLASHRVHRDRTEDRLPSLTLSISHEAQGR
ncbi:hypothetical protein K437DRAFT_123432 [Tilletiaria anomala UBC 951]|uniref:Uncharacterized protein n=1 Tax=Tilletiaria anomala (strain ATCC 24038 / CBS 436.72 / UBC 951) TaxID=1037660 RepID=A0A066W2K6_TILAU|nr:uncharacterized protein K437DRAFT_123432 [Tilletiaria anomala UBC 951]KDN45304.1 hypothetical protein K437DRAFT_123432 [Tilletiaria anomala UBC 951]